jgi:hypothetical protein
VDPATYDHRKACSLVTDDAVASELRDLLVNSADASSLKDAGNVALINDEMREAVFGSQFKTNGKIVYSDIVLNELNELVAELTRPLNLVYWLLEEDGYTLCSTRVRRKATLGSGATVVVSKFGRCVTQDADVALAYRTTLDFQRVERAAERAMYKAIEDARRIPALASKVPALINATNQSVQTQFALGMGNGNGNGGGHSS